MGTILPLDLCD